jgi:hypothetical protein
MAETGDAPSQASDVMMESSGRPKGKTSKDSYTVKQFKLHAVLICWLWDLRSEEEYTVVRGGVYSSYGLHQAARCG